MGTPELFQPPGVIHVDVQIGTGNLMELGLGRFDCCFEGRTLPELD
jgi:hypothetical protein